MRDVAVQHRGLRREVSTRRGENELVPRERRQACERERCCLRAWIRGEDRHSPIIILSLLGGAIEITIRTVRVDKRLARVIAPYVQHAVPHGAVED